MLLGGLRRGWRGIRVNFKQKVDNMSSISVLKKCALCVALVGSSVLFVGCAEETKKDSKKTTTSTTTSSPTGGTTVTTSATTSSTTTAHKD